MKIGDKVYISIKALYEKYGENLDYCGISHHINDENNSNFDTYDLYNGFDKLVCMDGEGCTVDSIDNNSESVRLINENGEEVETFYLSFDEYKTAAFM